MRYDKVWRDQYGNDITTIGNRNPMPWALEGEELLEYLFLICGGAFGAFSPSPWGSYLAKADEESDSLFERIGPEGFKTEDLNTAALNNLYDNRLVPWARETGYFYFHKKDKFDTTHKVMIDVFVEALIDAKALKSVESQLPLIRSAITMFLSCLHVIDVTKTEFTMSVQEEIKKRIDNYLPNTTKSVQIKELFVD